jgi:hypothetical protein
MQRRILVLLPLLLMSSGAVSAQHVEVTPFLNFRLGGEFVAIGTSDDYEIDRSFGYGLLLDIPVWDNLEVELLFSLQDSKVEAKGYSTDPTELDLEVHYYHLGLLRTWPWDRVETFLVTSAGITRFEPEAGAWDSFDDHDRFSAAVGGGVKIPLADHVGLRFDGRVFATWVNTESGTFCGRSGCLFHHEDSMMWQFETTAGLILDF